MYDDDLRAAVLSTTELFQSAHETAERMSRVYLKGRLYDHGEINYSRSLSERYGNMIGGIWGEMGCSQLTGWPWDRKPEIEDIGDINGVEVRTTLALQGCDVIWPKDRFDRMVLLMVGAWPRLWERGWITPAAAGGWVSCAAARTTATPPITGSSSGF